MPFIPATNVVQTELIYVWDGQICENVLHYQVPGGVTEASMFLIGATLVDWFDEALSPYMAPTIALTEVRMTDLTSEFAPGASFVAGLPIAGQSVAAALPNNVALSITKRTPFRGRAYRGRIYHMGLTETQVVDNQVIQVTVDILIAAYELIREIVDVGGDIPMVVVSKYQGSVPRAAALVTPVSGFSTDGVIDSQRRRLPKRGS